MTIFSRRHLLQVLGLSGLGILSGGCGTSLFESNLGNAFEPLNQAVGSLMLDPHRLVPEFPLSAIQPDALIVNTYDVTPTIDPAAYRLTVNGLVDHPLRLSLADLKSLPFQSMVIRHVCVEGWAAIVQWGGVPLAHLIALAGPHPQARYAYFYSADGYYESWDLASACHPQTLMAYQKNQAPLTVDNGAPLRLASPIKLGYKQSKWVTRVTLTDHLAVTQGYWEDQGYEWFGGL